MMKKILTWAGIALLFGGVALAANNYQITEGSGGKFFKCTDVGGFCIPYHIFADTSGNAIGTTTNPFTIQGLTWTVNLTPTVTVGTYTAGMTLGSKGTFTVPTVGSGGQVIVTYADLKDINGAVGQPINGNVDLLLFNANPSTSTFTDNSLYTIATADIPKLIGRLTVQCGVIGVAGATILGSTGPNPNALGDCSASNLSTPITIASGQTVYYVLVSDGQRVQQGTTDLFLSIAGTL